MFCYQIEIRNRSPNFIFLHLDETQLEKYGDGYTIAIDSWQNSLTGPYFEELIPAVNKQNQRKDGI